jgi:hypothetical protein
MKVLHNRTSVMVAFGVLHILSKGVKRYFNSNMTYILQYFQYKFILFYFPIAINLG